MIFINVYGMSAKKLINLMDKITYVFEIVIAFSLLTVIAIKIVEINLQMLGLEFAILAVDFDRILSSVLTLVIGVEFIKMLCKHTPETVIDVLLFAIARQMVVYSERTLDLLIGVAAMLGLFLTKKYLSDTNDIKGRKEEDSETS